MAEMTKQEGLAKELLVVFGSYLTESEYMGIARVALRYLQNNDVVIKEQLWQTYPDQPDELWEVEPLIGEG
ncbi:hypothetical protein LCGC14_1655140 [marine sediment metagenome]|uniref:Uncharacterized protein n=1 Tax=marine sediment metagenome TaxID=412755 RepID=A0A0F9HVP9_9ZZZZ